MRLRIIRAFRTFAFGACTSLALFTSLSASAATPTQIDVKALGSGGTEVDSIRGIESLTDWTTLDTQNLTLRVNHAEHYLLTLQDPCEHLRGAQLVGVSMTNQEIWADFDHVAADGYECRIDTITRLGRG